MQFFKFIGTASGLRRVITRWLSSRLRTEQPKAMDHSKRFAMTSLWCFAPLLLIAPSIAWIWLDHGSWMWDPAQYADDSVRLCALLKSHGKGWLHGLFSIERTRAPGLVWFGQFFVGLHPLFGSIERALLFCNMLFQAAIVWIIYDICRRLADGRKIVATACALFVSAAPLFVNLGHGYYVETFQLLTVALLWRLAVISPEISRLDLIISAAIVVVLGIDAKVSTPLFMGPPILLAALGTFGVLLPRPATPRNYKRLTRVFLLTATALISAFTLAWYIYNFRCVLTYLKLPLTTAFWGSFDPFPIKFLRWLHFLQISFLRGLVLYAALAAAVIAFFFHVRRGWRFERYRDSIALGGLASLILAITVYSMAPNEDYRLALPILPSIVIILAWALHKNHSPLVLVFCLVAIGYGFEVQGEALGIIPLRYPIWIKAVHTDLTLSKELTALVNLTSTPETDNHSQICGVNYPWLNSFVLSFYAAKEKVLNGGFMPSYTENGLWPEDSDVDKALKYTNSINPKFIISVREDLQPPPNLINTVNLAYLSHVRADPRYEQVEFPSTLGIIVFKRVDDLPGG